MHSVASPAPVQARAPRRPARSLIAAALIGLTVASAALSAVVSVDAHRERMLPSSAACSAHPGPSSLFICGHATVGAGPAAGRVVPPVAASVG